MSSGQLIPEAYFDCLAILVSAPHSVSPLSTRELHLFSYLACLLALFEGEPIGAWGYQFALTSRGYPHSADFEIARLMLSDLGMMSLADSNSYCATERAIAEHKGLSQLNRFKIREKWLQVATDCALALPVGSIRYAVTARSDLASAIGSEQPRSLVTGSYVDRIHDERRAIEEALGGNSPDLLAPAVAWLSLYILNSKDQLAA